MNSPSNNKDINCHFNNDGDILITMSMAFLNKQGIKIGDTYDIQVSEYKIELIPTRQMSA